MEMNLLKVTILGEEKLIEKGVVIEELVDEYKDKVKGSIVLVKKNNKLCELSKTIEQNCTLEFITTAVSDGSRTYKRSCIFLMLKAIKDTLGTEIKKVVIKYSISKGYYCEPECDRELLQEDLDNILARMRELVRQEIPFVKRTISLEEAITLFENRNMLDKVELLKYRKSSTINIYELDGEIDYFYGYMVPNTKYLTKFGLTKYEKGFSLQMPSSDKPSEIAEFVPHPKLFTILSEASHWGNMMGVDTVAGLNNAIVNGKINELILVQEALQEKKIAQIADAIAAQRDKKIVLIAGPSSSGKTTFSHRLSIQLKTHGLKPHPIPVDDYFVPRVKTPIDEYGKPNYECLEAIDIELFNKNMEDLLEGKKVELPTYNFKTGEREYKGRVKQIGHDDILVIEGIHALNDEMTYRLSKDNKFKIYISALTQINVDDHNRISTTDGRLLRRMVRDSQYRGTSAEATLEMWASVNRGERSNIFPYQEDADVMFNSALVYELAVLKMYAEPLLFGIPKTSEHYNEAVRLLKFLDYTLGLSSEKIPGNSIIREFIGGSILSV